MYGPHGKKASEVIEMLKEMIRKHGDQEVMISGGDYPEGASGVSYREHEGKGFDGYYPKKCFVL